MKQDKLKSFLYVLMRDEVVPGVVEEIVRDHAEAVAAKEIIYSNPFLAAYADELAKRLVS